MKTKLIRFYIVSILLLLFTACATDRTSASLTETEKQMNHIYAATKVKTIYFIDVPSPNNIISEKIAVATMALEGSKAVDALDAFLKKNALVHIGIIGKSQAINVATVKQSLKNMANKPAQGTVYLIAGESEKSELDALNNNKNISIVVVSPLHK